MRTFGHRSSSRRVRTNSLGFLGLVLFVILAILPIAFSLGYAAAYSVGAVGLLSDAVTVAHWAKLFRQSEILTSFLLSIYIAGATVVITVSLALFFALYLRRPLQQGALSYIIYFPLALPATVAAFLVFQLFSTAGFFSRIMLEIGVIGDMSGFPGLVHDRLGFGIVAAHVGLAVPFFAVLFVQIYRTEHIAELTRVAQTLGASRWQAIARVPVPIILTKSTTNIILLFIAVLGSYEIPLLLGRQAPQMISVLTMRKYALFDIAQKPEAFVVALLYTMVVLLLIILALRRGRLSYDL